MNVNGEPVFDDLSAAVARLSAGGVVAFPTETVYGLGADALSDAAVRRVFELKGRPTCNPLIVHVAGPDMARRVAAQWPDEAGRLAAMFWPGPLSIILPKRADIPGSVTAGGAGVAVRCPDHPIALALLYQLGRPLVGPSANRSGGISPTTAAHVRESFSERDVLVLNGGPCATGIESTVLSLLDGRARVLRSGVISPADIQRVIGREVTWESGNLNVAGPGRADGDGTPLESPGLLVRHYAPAMPARLLSPGEIAALLAPAEGAASRTLAVLAHTLREAPVPHVLLPMPADDAGYAASLYAALRRAEAARPAEILIERPPTDSATWQAIWDRLRRACAPA